MIRSVLTSALWPICSLCCSANKYSAKGSDELTDCGPCPKHSYIESGLCKGCPLGKYTNFVSTGAVGLTACLACPAGTAGAYVSAIADALVSAGTSTGLGCVTCYGNQADVFDSDNNVVVSQVRLYSATNPTGNSACTVCPTGSAVNRFALVPASTQSTTTTNSLGFLGASTCLACAPVSSRSYTLLMISLHATHDM